MRRFITAANIASLLGATLLAGCGKGVMTSPHAANAPIRSSQLASSTAPRFSNRVVVKYKTGTSDSAVRSLHQRFALSTVRDVSSLGMGVLGLPASMTAESALAKLQGHPAVEFAEPDYVFALPKQGKLAAVRKLQGVSLADGSMLSDEWGMQKIGMQTVWPVNGGSAGVIVAVVDTGVDLNHPDLRHALVPGTSVLGGSGGPQDDHGHGTHVSGVIVGAVNDGTGIGGIAPNCKLMPVKVLNSEGKGDTGDIVAGLIWAVNNGAKVINMSLGGTGGSRALMAAVKYAQSKDVVLVAAMGNESSNSQEYPAGYPGVIAVGATDEQDQQSDFSNFGSWISISAPGSDILSSLPMGDAYVSRVEGHNRGYDRMDGTSMAAPFVAGVAALVRSAEPRLTAAQIKQRLEKTADDLGDPGFDEQFGWGRLNAARALAGR